MKKITREQNLNIQSKFYGKIVRKSPNFFSTTEFLRGIATACKYFT